MRINSTNIKNSIKEILIYFWKKAYPIKDQGYLFIMGHPRSGSSLLMHMLASNKDISGFGEYFIKYTNNKSLIKAEFDIRRKSGGLFKQFKYIVNQVNHHSITPKIGLLMSDNFKFIFLIRKPEETLSSMFLLSERVNKPMTQESITAVYIERLKNLSEIVSVLDPNQWIYITYENIVKNTDREILKLNQFLDLEDGLLPEYEIQKFTQIWGDSSENIKKGNVFETKSTQKSFNNYLLLKANNSYSEILHILQNTCITH